MNNWLLISIGIVIFMLLYFLPSIGIGIKKFRKSSRSSKKQRATTSKSTPDAGNVNTPHSGHAVHPTTTKPKSKIISKIVSVVLTIGLIVLVVVLIAWAGPFVKQKWNKIFEPSPKYQTVIVYDRTATVNLDSDWSDANTVYLDKSKGETCDFKNATVSFCAHNLNGEMVCGDAYTDPNLPAGSGNEKLWFKSKDGPHGAIEVVIFRREKQLVK